MRQIIVSFFVFLCMAPAHAQAYNIDSLKLVLQKQTTDTGKIEKLMLLGFAYSAIRNDSAFICLSEALNRSINVGYKPGEIRARHQIAFFLYDVKSDYATAIDLYFKNLRVLNQMSDTFFLIAYQRFFDMRDIGFIYEKLKDYDKQLEYTIKLRDLIINNGIYNDSASVVQEKGILYARLGAAYFNLNQLDSAKFYYNKVWKWHYGYSPSISIAVSANGLGNVFTKESKKDSAAYYYHISMLAALSVKRYDIYNRDVIALAKLYWQNKQSDSAFYYARLANNVATEKRVFDQQVESSELLAEIYYSRKQPDSAYKYLNHSIRLKDSIFSEDKIAQVQNLTLRNSLLQKEEEYAKKEAMQQYQSTIKMYGLLAGLVILLIISLLSFRNIRQRQIAHKKITKAYDELKSTQAQLIQQEKMASLGELTAGIAHEIQNPLNFVNNFSEVNTELIDELQGERSKVKDERNEQLENEIINDVKQNLEKIIHHGKRADAIVKGMLQHSRVSTGQKELTDINALADEYLRLSYHGMRAKDKLFNATMQTDFDTTIGKINIVPQDIGRVLLNLFNNAFYGVTEKKKQAGEEYEPAVSVSTKKIEGKISISVRDNGIGIPQKVVDKIFQPFFTTKPTGQGTGLGLSLSYDIIKAHGGEIKVESKEGEWSEFTIQLPIS
jgi:two-component system NtrC family sensor kinase